MFRAEVRFYREIAAVAGVRVPACYQAEETDEGTVVVLEDLSAWEPGADPAVAAALLASMHRRWAGRAHPRWPWLRPAGAGAGLVAELFDRTWERLAERPDLPAAVTAFGASAAGRAADAERAVAGAGPATLVHGDASTRNMRTRPRSGPLAGADGEVVFLDWEDVSAAPGVLDLAWLLTSSVDPARWDEVIGAYGPADGLSRVLPAVIVQGLLSLADTSAGSAEAAAWTGRLDTACARLRMAA